MARSICIIQGHPHGTGAHLCHALAVAYARGATGVRWFRSGVLGLSGVRPIRTSYMGMVDKQGADGVGRWCARREALGRQAR